MVVVGGITMLSSCGNRTIYSKYRKISNYVWNYSDKISFDVKISDTTEVYDIFLRLRIASVYPYSNIWNVIFARREACTEADDGGDIEGVVYSQTLCPDNFFKHRGNHQTSLFP